MAAARIELLLAQAEVRGLEALLAEGLIRAPADGWTLETAAAAGSSVVEGAVLARMADASSMGVRLHVPNTEIQYFDSLENLTVEDGAGNPHTIRRIIRPGASGPNATLVELWLDEGTPKSVGAASVKFTSSRDSLCVPWTSVATDDDRAWIGLLDKETRVRRRAITLGATTGTMVEVVDGLAGGDVILLYQPRSHGEGALVEPARREGTREAGK